MTRDVVFGLSVLSIALLACGGGNRPATEGGGDIVRIVRKDFGSDAYNMPATFARLSRKHGCNVEEKSDSAVSFCNAGIIALVRDGTVVSVGCKGMSYDNCSHLFSAIVDEAKH
ncbi:MAG: hypothetical protein HYV09_37420 [Deltaproteobacteria bacterium]|nr:hypothetical protein [Deltaproteobacteria bacterium]